MRKEFQVHLLNEDGIKLATEMAEKFSDLLTWIHEKCDCGAELTIAGRKLEEACFYAIKALALDATYQDRDRQ